MLFSATSTEEEIDRIAHVWTSQARQFTDRDERLGFVDHLRRSALAREDGTERRGFLRAVEWIEKEDAR